MIVEARAADPESPFPPVGATADPAAKAVDVMTSILKRCAIVHADGCRSRVATEGGGAAASVIVRVSFVARKNVSVCALNSNFGTR